MGYTEAFKQMAELAAVQIPEKDYLKPTSLF